MHHTQECMCECGQFLKTSRPSSVSHQKNHYSVETKFICIICGKTFTRSANLKRHRREVHGLGIYI